MGCGGGAESWYEGCGPPTGVHTHTLTHTRSGLSLGKTIPSFKMLPRQVLPASWEGEGKPPECLPPTSPSQTGRQEWGVKPLLVFVADFCSFPPSLPTFRDTCRGQRCLAGAPVQFLPQLLPVVLGSVQDPKSQLPFPV